MKALFVDFDGVLHPSVEILNKDIPRLALLGSQPLLQLGLCRWAGLLEDALQQGSGPDDLEISVIVHSSWRNTSWATTQLVREMLGPLGHRFAGFTQAHVARERSIDDCIQRAGIQDHLILDDACDDFTPGRDSLVVTNPLLGLSEPSALAKVSEWALNWRDADLLVPVP